jgi:hypothetical protein
MHATTETAAIPTLFALDPETGEALSALAFCSLSCRAQFAETSTAPLKAGYAPVALLDDAHACDHCSTRISPATL